jgi:hypothetical protein
MEDFARDKGTSSVREVSAMGYFRGIYRKR